MQRANRSSRRTPAEPVRMDDRERTIFAAAEALFGAALVIIGILLGVGTRGVGDAIGLATLILGMVACAQAVLVGVGLTHVYDRRPPGGSDD
jgi:hypothetical protein